MDNIKQVHELLDQIESTSGPKSLVVTGSNPKIFNGGMNLKLIAEHGMSMAAMLISECMKLWGRVLGIGVPTVAAINGWCVAGGMIMATACDYRFMQQGAKIQLSEILVGFPPPEGSSGILRAKFDAGTVRDLFQRGVTMTSNESL